MKSCAIGSVQEQTKLVKMFINIIHHIQHGIAGILPHLPLLSLTVKAVKGLLHILLDLIPYPPQGKLSNLPFDHCSISGRLR